MASVSEGFNMGMSAGRSIRQGIDRQQALEYQRARDASLERHRLWSEQKQQEQLDLQKRQQDNVLLQQMHAVLNNPQMHPEAKSFIIDDIARQRGHDPKSEYYQGFKKMLLKMPADQSRSLMKGLVTAFPNLDPGKVGEIVDGLFSGGIPPTQIPGLVKGLSAYSDAQAAKDAEAGIIPAPAPESAPDTSGAPAGAIQGAPAGGSDTFGAPEDAGGADFGAVDPGMDSNTALGGFMPGTPGASGADFSDPTMQGGGSQGGALNDLAANGGASFTGASPAQPGMAGQLDQMRAGMDQNGGVPPGGPLLKDVLVPRAKPGAAQAAPAQAATAAPMQSAASAPVVGASGEPPMEAEAPVNPEQTSEYWLGEAARFDQLAEQAVRNRGTGKNFRDQANAARNQAKAISDTKSKTAKMPRDPKKQAGGIAAMLQDAMDAPLEFGDRATERALGPWSATVADTGTIGSAISAVINFMPQFVVRANSEIDAMIEGGAKPTEVRDRIEAKNDRIAMMMKAFVRLPGEGVWSDKDQAFLIKLLSGTSRSRSVDEYEARLVDVKDYIEHTLGFELPMPGAKDIQAPPEVKPWQEMVRQGAESAGGALRGKVNGVGQGAADWFDEAKKATRRSPPMIRRTGPQMGR